MLMNCLTEAGERIVLKSIEAVATVLIASVPIIVALIEKEDKSEKKSA